MSIYATVIGTIAGICLGYGILYFFIGLRRGEDQRLNLSFALFALGYAGTLLMGIAYRSQETAADYLALSRWDGIFIWLAFVALNWFVAAYTGVKAKWYLWGFTIFISVLIMAAMLTPTLNFSVMPELAMIPLPWNEEVPTLVGEENIWGLLLLLAQLVTLGFIVAAGMGQYRRGKRQAALVLLGGMAWFIVALLYEILAEVGLWVYVPLAETGFLGIAIAMSLQMANTVIKTEEALAASEKNLEGMVVERTAELQEAQARLIDQAQETAVIEERRRIARDLHDEVTQTIYSASLITEVLPQVWERSPEEGRRNLTKLRQLVRGALAEMRTLLFELRPAALENTDLQLLLPQLADAFSGRTRIPVRVRVDGEEKLPVAVKVAFYRISQEALNNVAKHAGATEVSLTFEQKEDGARLVVVDNGRGFDPAAAGSEGMGLISMRERAAAIGAQMEVKSKLGVGAELLLRWQPVMHDEERMGQ
jgi:signal transduction histidine kinase